MRKTNRQQKFLGDYKATRDWFIPPDAVRGRPGLMLAETKQGQDVLVKVWPRTSKKDDDLLHIWRSEIRQLHRLAAIPRADDLFVPMAASGEDDEGFYLVLDPGQGSPLERFRASGRTAVLQQPQLARNRRLIWANGLRIARALDLLHGQGVIHRNVDPWAIVTSLGGEPDFRLTGFEWSMRIAAMDAQPRGKGGAAETTASFAQDWRNLGLLIAQLLEAPVDRIADLKIVRSEIAPALSPAEGKVLRVLMGLEKLTRLDGEEICGRIEEIVGSLDAEVASKETRLGVALSLGRGSKLSEAIRRASGDEIAMTDVEAQLQFVLDDLSAEPFFGRMRAGSEVQHVLLGQRVAYILSPFRDPKSTIVAAWEFASCERGSVSRPGLEPYVKIAPERLDMRAVPEAYKSFALRRGRFARWDEMIAALEPEEAKKTELDRKHQSFALLALLEMAYAAADIFPVEVLPGAADMRGELHVLRLASRKDEARAALSKALKIEAPAIRLARMIEADDVRGPGDTGWVVVRVGELGERDKDSQWRFVERREEGGREVLTFEGAEQTQVQGPAFLAPAGMRGQIAQFRRRVKALRTLRQHTELLGMLVDRHQRIDKSHDPIMKDKRFKEQLDESKQQALVEILSTIPLFLLQGPPGVGKTYLVGDIVRRRFDDEPGGRLLLSAQSNAAIDHLMKEVRASVDEEKLVIVRARGPDDDDADTELEIDQQASRHLDALAGSDMLKECDPKIARKVRNLAAAAKQKRKDGQRPMAAEGRAFEAMILRAANLVFATTNSAAVETLIDEQGFFDWSIVEEAGKATGGELVSPLLLSHRRLMIGDHKQLPPYGADRMEKLLRDEGAVRGAVKAAEALIARYLRDPAMEEIFDEVKGDGIDYGRLCADTLEILNLFAGLVEAEVAVRPGKVQRTAIARRLDVQHRMHPAIADIVSACFYEDKLRTDAKKAREYRAGPPPVSTVDATLMPATPIVFVDMPYCQEQVGYRGGDQGPAWSNPDEVAAVVRALELLHPVAGRDPSLAVLSPYREQVKRLTAALKRARRLAHLAGFRTAVEDKEYCGTVDSFQGDQADVVVVSMVRNNGHATPLRALGFLADDRRMNVLLSRGRWKLVIVGSLRFYENVVGLAQSFPEEQIGFLAKFLTALERAKAAGDASIVPWATLVGGRA